MNTQHAPTPSKRQAAPRSPSGSLHTASATRNPQSGGTIHRTKASATSVISVSAGVAKRLPLSQAMTPLVRRGGAAAGSMARRTKGKGEAGEEDMSLIAGS